MLLPLYRSSVAVIAGLALCLAAAAAEDLPVQAGPLAESQCYVGQQLRLPVTLFFVDRPTSSPRFDIPEPSGGMLLKLPGSPIYGTRKLEGVSYSTWTYDFAYYPHRAGTHTIPPISGRAGDLKGTSEAVELEAVLPPGAEGLATLVSTSKLEVTETWHPQPDGSAMAGDAFTRTVTLRAPDVLGMGFPPLPATKPDKVAVYPKPPQVDDKVARGDVSGSRIETIVYLCESAGEVTLPAITIPWFDLEAGEMRRVDLPSQTLQVAPNPAHLQAEGQGDTAQSRAHQRWIMLSAGFALLATAIAFRYRSRIAAAIKGYRQRRHDSEAQCFRRLLRAAHSGDAPATINLVPTWLQSLPGDEKPRTLRTLAEEADDTALLTEIDSLFASRYSSNSTETWDGSRFAEQLIKARRSMLRSTALKPPSLPELNPR